MADNRTLEELETRAAELTGGFYYTQQQLGINVGCYCIGGLFGMLLLPLAVSASPWFWLVMAIYYIVMFIILPPVLKRAAALEIINNKT